MGEFEDLAWQNVGFQIVIIVVIGALFVGACYLIATGGW